MDQVFPLIKLAKKLKAIRIKAAKAKTEKQFPLIKLAKKLKDERPNLWGLRYRVSIN